MLDRYILEQIREKLSLVMEDSVYEVSKQVIIRIDVKRGTRTGEEQEKFITVGVSAFNYACQKGRTEQGQQFAFTKVASKLEPGHSVNNTKIATKLPDYDKETTSEHVKRTLLEKIKKAESEGNEEAAKNLRVELEAEKKKRDVSTVKSPWMMFIDFLNAALREKKWASRGVDGFTAKALSAEERDDLEVEREAYYQEASKLREEIDSLEKSSEEEEELKRSRPDDYYKTDKFIKIVAKRKEIFRSILGLREKENEAKRKYAEIGTKLESDNKASLVATYGYAVMHPSQWKYKDCENCAGTGGTNCATCNGEGIIDDGKKRKCKSCLGSGRSCTDCFGLGYWRTQYSPTINKINYTSLNLSSKMKKFFSKLGKKYPKNEDESDIDWLQRIIKGKMEPVELLKVRIYLMNIKDKTPRRERTIRKWKKLLKDAKDAEIKVDPNLPWAALWSSLDKRYVADYERERAAKAFAKLPEGTEVEEFVTRYLNARGIRAAHVKVSEVAEDAGIDFLRQEIISYISRADRESLGEGIIKEARSRGKYNEEANDDIATVEYEIRTGPLENPAEELALTLRAFRNRLKIDWFDIQLADDRAINISTQIKTIGARVKGRGSSLEAGMPIQLGFRKERLSPADPVDQWLFPSVVYDPTIYGGKGGLVIGKGEPLRIGIQDIKGEKFGTVEDVIRNIYNSIGKCLGKGIEEIIGAKGSSTWREYYEEQLSKEIDSKASEEIEIINYEAQARKRKAREEWEKEKINADMKTKIEKIEAEYRGGRNELGKLTDALCYVCDGKKQVIEQVGDSQIRKACSSCGATGLDEAPHLRTLARMMRYGRQDGILIGLEKTREDLKAKMDALLKEPDSGREVCTNCQGYGFNDKEMTAEAKEISQKMHRDAGKKMLVRQEYRDYEKEKEQELNPSILEQLKVLTLKDLARKEETLQLNALTAQGSLRQRKIRESDIRALLAEPAAEPCMHLGALISKFTARANQEIKHDMTREELEGIVTNIIKGEHHDSEQRRIAILSSVKQNKPYKKSKDSKEPKVEWIDGESVQHTIFEAGQKRFDDDDDDDAETKKFLQDLEVIDSGSSDLFETTPKNIFLGSDVTYRRANANAYYLLCSTCEAHFKKVEGGAQERDYYIPRLEVFRLKKQKLNEISGQISDLIIKNLCSDCEIKLKGEAPSEKLRDYLSGRSRSTIGCEKCSLDSAMKSVRDNEYWSEADLSKWEKLFKEERALSDKIYEKCYKCEGGKVKQIEDYKKQIRSIDFKIYARRDELRVGMPFTGLAGTQIGSLLASKRSRAGRKTQLEQERIKGLLRCYVFAMEILKKLEQESFLMKSENAVRAIEIALKERLRLSDLIKEMNTEKMSAIKSAISVGDLSENLAAVDRLDSSKIEIISNAHLNSGYAAIHKTLRKIVAMPTRLLSYREVEGGEAGDEISDKTDELYDQVQTILYGGELEGVRYKGILSILNEAGIEEEDGIKLINEYIGDRLRMPVDVSDFDGYIERMREGMYIYNTTIVALLKQIHNNNIEDLIKRANIEEAMEKAIIDGNYAAVKFLTEKLEALNIPHGDEASQLLIAARRKVKLMREFLRDNPDVRDALLEITGVRKNVKFSEAAREKAKSIYHLYQEKGASEHLAILAEEFAEKDRDLLYPRPIMNNEGEFEDMPMQEALQYYGKNNNILSKFTEGKTLTEEERIGYYRYLQL